MQKFKVICNIGNKYFESFCIAHNMITALQLYKDLYMHVKYITKISSVSDDEKEKILNIF